MESSSHTKLHIVSFNVPYPPDYGGIIDVFYKLKWLKELGIKIHLHTFIYDRKPDAELEKYCEKVYYYKRKRNITALLSSIPFIVITRNSRDLLKRLHSDNFPILFEGLHSCYYLKHPSLTKRMKIVRMHNVEHTYYLNLAFSTNKIINKVFFLLESLKLRFFENRLSFAQYILSISPGENNYFNRKFGNSILVPPFHPFEEPKGIKGKGRYILLHGNLSVPDNIRSTLYIIGKLDKKVDFPVIIAGKNPTREIIQLGTKNSNITVISSPGIEEMHSLIRNSHIIILHTYQQTGSKLKLLDSIYLGRFVIANSLMLNDTGMESFCEKADTPDELIEKINQMLEKTFNDDLFSQRGALFTKFSNKKNAETITKLILNHPDDVP